MGWPKGVKRGPNPNGRTPGSGRKPGTPNKVTVVVSAYARGLVEDTQVQAKILEQAREGTLPAPLMVLLFHYAYGKPPETIRHGLDEASMDLAARLQRAHQQLEEQRHVRRFTSPE